VDWPIGLSSRFWQPANDGDGMPAPKLDLCRTGNTGLDYILHGGLPRHRLFMVQGDPGVGKTTLALQFLMEGARSGEKGLYITLSETKDELEAVADSHGWSLDGIELLELTAAEQESMVESPNTLFHPSEVELMQTVRQVQDRIDRSGPDRVVIDSLSEFRLLAHDALHYRRQMLAFKHYFARKGATVLFLEDRGPGDPEQLVQSIAHGVVSMKRMVSEFGAERRQLSVVKMRGMQYESGSHDYSIVTGGLAVYPRLKVSSKAATVVSVDPIASGIPALDDLLGGGIERGTGSLIIGPAGAGKSSIAAQYAVSAAERGERVVILLFDENVHTYVKRAEDLGMRMQDQLRAGKIVLRHLDAAEISPGEMAHSICNMSEKDGFQVVIIDSLNGYMNAMPEEKFLLLQLHELLAYLSQRGVASILVMAQHGFLGEMHTPADLTYLADTVILLRYFEFGGLLKKAISVIKKRSGFHENAIREFAIRDSRIVVGEPLKEFRGVLKGVPNYIGGAEGIISSSFGEFR
jgi:circadian clock protein KaiC